MKLTTCFRFWGCSPLKNLQIKEVARNSRNMCQSALSHQVQSIEIPNTQDEQNAFEDALKHPDYFGVAKMFNVEDLFKARVHLGHREGSLCNYMKPYIFGSRLGNLILDLDKTSVLLRDALNFTGHIAFRGGVILFVCRGAQHQIMIEKMAEDCQEYAHTRHWNLGTLTNSTKYYGCVTRLPDLIIFLNTMNDVMAQHEGVKDAARMLIPSIGIVDTNSDPRLITYPVPGNDDSHSAIKLYCNMFKQVILTAKSKRKEVSSLS